MQGCHICDGSEITDISLTKANICQADIYIYTNTGQVDPLLYEGSFNLKKFPDIFSKFPDLEKSLFLPDNSPTHGNPVLCKQEGLSVEVKPRTCL